jgi:ABC-type Mn2+/Zn2+ transport system permease subunit
MLSLVGVWVVARDQIFLGAAVSQASTLGTALAIWIQGGAIAHAVGSEALTFTFAVLASVATALLTSRPARPGAESSEAVTGWVFLVGSSIPVLLLASNPHGLEEVHRLLFSSILGASRIDVFLFCGLLVVTLVGAFRLRDRIILYAMDPEMAGAVGMRLGVWRLGTAVWLGVAVGLSIHSAGMIYSFGCLVLPALAARKLCREVRPMFWVAPVIGLGTAVVSFVVAHDLDWPPAQLTVAVQCAVLGGAWTWRRFS